MYQFRLMLTFANPWADGSLATKPMGGARERNSSCQLDHNSYCHGDHYGMGPT